MSWSLFALVLAAAVLHAVWNALIKHGGDPFLRLALVNLTGSVLCLPLLPFVPPPVAAAWPWIVVSLIIHIGYSSFLSLAYGRGDLSLVYPLARGIAPPLVALFGWLAAGEAPSSGGLVALALISGAILALALERRTLAHDGSARAMALLCGLCIAGYTLSDGMGVRTAQSAISYIVWFLFLDGLPFGLGVLYGQRRRLRTALPPSLFAGIAGGVLSFSAYALVIWAMRSTPMAYVSALRETSVIFAALIGARLLGEPRGRERIALACLTVGGIGLLKLAG